MAGESDRATGFREAIPAASLVAASVPLFVAGIVQLGSGSVMPGWILLLVGWALAATGFFLSPNIRRKWRWGSASIALSLLVGCVIGVSGYSARGTGDLPLPAKGESPAAPAEAPVVGPGATVIQKTEGESSHNIIAREVLVEGTRRRLISAEQRTRLIEALKRGPKGDVKLASVSGDVEGNAFADQIRETLDASGWPDCDPSQRVYVGGNPVGFGVVVHDAEDPPPHAAVLQQAFESVGIACGEAEDPDVPESVVEVLVGTQP